jgi:hypothetical protein
MELRVNIGINELIGLIRQLPPEDKLLIKKEVDSQLNSIKNNENSNSLTDFLLSGPTMTRQEEDNFRKIDL